MEDKIDDGVKKQRMKLPKLSIAALAVGLGGPAFIGLMLWAVSAMSFIYYMIIPLIVLLIAALSVGLILGIIAIPVCKRQSSKTGMGMSIVAIIVPFIIITVVLVVIFFPTILIMMFGM